ncbi:acyltransferase family protein [Falsirhodobacter sp. 1013]|uniref:acyltransferase family protein n=1 Tax=Falsirhodobacter sp. 1013 TaxID=3417566 RepID=UPI003EBAB268
MKYRPEIDGLRTIAVLPVILFHAGVPGLDGGFIGVDIFFVISGFLITTILVQDMEAGRHSLLTFYERRARRILPALFTVILACLPFAWMWMFPTQLRDFGQSVIATALFASNILFWKETGYFSVGVDLKPLLHTWSLAIEEQYYILFPVLLALAWRLGRKAVFGMVLAIAVVSLGLTQVLSRTHPDFAFYLLPTRAWELMCGALGAFWTLWRRPAPSQALALAGAACLLVAFAAFDARTPHPSLWTLLPVAGTTLVLVFARQGTAVARVLSLRPLVAIGLISYSAYLWHQPLFAFARLRSITDPTLVLMLSLAVLSLILAALTWKFVEEPFRRHQGRPPRLLPRRAPLLGASTLAIVATIGIGGTLHAINGAPWRTPEAAMRYLAAKDDYNPLRDVCLQNIINTDKIRLPPDPVCTSTVNLGGPRSIIIGDSHADVFASPLREALEAKGWQVTQVTAGACGPIPGVRKGVRNCAAIYDAVLEYLKQEKFDLVIAGMRHQPDFATGIFDNGQGGQDPDWTVGGTTPVYDAKTLGLAGSPTQATFAAAALRRGMSDLLALGTPVIVVHAVPEAGWNVPEVAAKRAFHLGEQTPDVFTDRSAYDQRAKPGNDILDAIADPNLFHVRPADLLCDDIRCTNARNGNIYYYDDDHLSLAGGALIANAILAQLPAVTRIAEVFKGDALGQ